MCHSVYAVFIQKYSLIAIHFPQVSQMKQVLSSYRTYIQVSLQRTKYFLHF